MMLQGCRTNDRAEVVESGRFATPNSLKSHGERNLLSPFSNPCAITPKLGMLSRPIHPSKNYPALKSTYRGYISIAPAAPPVPHFPRFRALALFGRRPPQCVDSLVMPASENLHNSGHSITSSARATRAGGTVTPMALAVLRLITRSNLNGCSTGT